MEEAHDKKTNIAPFHLYQISNILEFIDLKIGMVVAKGWRREKWGKDVLKQQA